MFSKTILKPIFRAWKSKELESWVLSMQRGHGRSVRATKPHRNWHRQRKTNLRLLSSNEWKKESSNTFCILTLCCCMRSRLSWKTLKYLRSSGSTRCSGYGVGLSTLGRHPRRTNDSVVDISPDFSATFHSWQIIQTYSIHYKCQIPSVLVCVYLCLYTATVTHVSKKQAK